MGAPPLVAARLPRMLRSKSGRWSLRRMTCVRCACQIRRLSWRQSPRKMHPQLAPSVTLIDANLLASTSRSLRDAKMAPIARGVTSAISATARSRRMTASNQRPLSVHPPRAASGGSGGAHGVAGSRTGVECMLERSTRQRPGARSKWLNALVAESCVVFCSSGFNA